jgi:membrane protease YdiL (CAAX protease family)
MSEQYTKSLWNLLQLIFISPDEPRLRAGWRLLGQLAILMIAALVLGFPLVFLSLFFNITDLLMIEPLISLPAITFSVYLARRFLDRRSFVSLGLRMDRRALIDTLTGMGIAAVIMALIFAIEFIFGWLKIEGFVWNLQPASSFAPGLIFFFVLFLAVGFYEELLSRGYHLQNLEEGMNTPLAVFLSSAIFGVGHYGNPNATWFSVLGIIAAGYFLAYGYLRTRQLWLPIGLHIGWNIFEGPVFGFPVSGIVTDRLLHHQVNGPELITGGAFGPEAGLILLPAIALGVVLIYYYTQNRNKEE